MVGPRSGAEHRRRHGLRPASDRRGCPGQSARDRDRDPERAGSPNWSRRSPVLCDQRPGRSEPGQVRARARCPECRWLRHFPSVDAYLWPPYQWVSGHSFDDVELPDLPPELAKLIVGAKTNGQTAGPGRDGRDLFGRARIEELLQELETRPQVAKGGGWREPMLRLVGSMLARRTPPDVILAVCRRATWTQAGYTHEDTDAWVEKCVKETQERWSLTRPTMPTRHTFDQNDAQLNRTETPLPLLREMPPATRSRSMLSAPCSAARPGRSTTASRRRWRLRAVDARGGGARRPGPRRRPAADRAEAPGLADLLSVAATGERKTACGEERCGRFGSMKRTCGPTTIGGCSLVR